MAQHKSELVLIKNIQCLALIGEPFGVYCEVFGEIWPPYNVTALNLAELLGQALSWKRYVVDVKFVENQLYFLAVASSSINFVQFNTIGDKQELLLTKYHS